MYDVKKNNEMILSHLLIRCNNKLLTNRSITINDSKFLKISYEM